MLEISLLDNLKINRSNFIVHVPVLNRLCYSLDFTFFVIFKVVFCQLFIF